MSATESILAGGRATSLSLKDRLLQVSNRGWVHAAILLVLMAVAVAHQLVPGLQEWFIEDAAISFSYSRNLAAGEGLVPWAGGERVEGYSNPTWVFLISFFCWFGADPFDTAKVLAGVLAALTVPLTYLCTREALPEDTRGDAALIGALAFAMNSQAAIWAASGLENSLFNFLLAAALWRTFVELRKGGLPTSAFLFFLLAITRPEAIMYAALAGFCTMVWHLRAGRGILPTVLWLVGFWVPFGLYFAWRFWYFAWELPNTYYAKDRNHNMQNWGPFRGWKQFRSWSHEVWHLYLLPLYVGAVATFRGLRGAVALCMTVLTVLALFYPGTETLREVFPSMEIGPLPAPDWWDGIKPWLVLFFALTVPVLGLGAIRGWQARVLCWLMLSATVFFAVWSNGDWMKGYRWYSLLAVPVSVLFGVGVTEAANLAQRWLSSTTTRWTLPGTVVAVVVGSLVVPANALYTQHWLIKRETGPFVVRKRVNYYTYVKNRLWLDEVKHWDVDQGAHLFWSDFQMMDMAGLIDVPVAHHRYEKPFIREHFFEEGKPEFAHVHGGWASTSRIPTHPEWREDYVEIPGYPAGRRQLHIGNFVRRDIFLEEAWSGVEGRAIRYPNGFVLEGWEIPSPETARARSWYFEIGASSEVRSEEENPRLLLFLSNGTETQSWDVPLGYDWVMPHDWRPDEVFHGKFSVDLNKPLTLGKYWVGFVVLDAEGEVVAPEPDANGDWSSLPAGAVVGGFGDEPALFMEGEVRWPDAFEVVTVEKNAANARQDRELARRLAGELKCEQAERAWFEARMHRPKNKEWRQKYEPALRNTLATCWAGRALDDPTKEVDALERARSWNHWNLEYRTVAEPVADALYARGMAARALNDWPTAYRLFSDTLRVDPQRSWARRYAEEARDYRLGLDAGTQERRRQQAAERRQRMMERRDRMKNELETPEKPPAGEAAAPPAPDGPEAE